MSRRYLAISVAAILGAPVFFPSSPTALAEKATTPVSPSAEQTKAERAQEILEKIAQEEKIRRQEKEFLGQHWFTVAQKHFDAKEYDRAIQCLKKSLELRPDFQPAQALLEKARAAVGIGSRPNPADILQQAAEEKEVARRMVQSEMKDALARGKLKFEAGQFKEAADLFQTVVSVGTANPGLEGSAERVKEAQSALKACRDGMRAQETEASDRAEKEALRIISEERLRQQRVSEERKKTLMKRAKDACQHESYALAGNLVEEVLAVDPSEPKAKAMLKQIQESRTHHRAEAAGVATREKSREIMIQAATQAIPTAGLYQYPDNWRDLSRKRLKAKAPIEELAEWQKKIIEQLQKKVTFDFVETPIADVIAFLQNLTGVNMVIDASVITADDKPVTLKVSEMRLGAALDWILRLTDLTYGVQDEAVYVTTTDRLKKTTVLRIYDVSDLLANIPDYSGSGVPSIEGGGDEGGGGDLFAGGGDDDNAVFSGEDLVDLIRTLVAPSSWDEGGEN